MKNKMEEEKSAETIEDFPEIPEDVIDIVRKYKPNLGKQDKLDGGKEYAILKTKVRKMDVEVKSSISYDTTTCSIIYSEVVIDNKTGEEYQGRFIENIKKEAIKICIGNHNQLVRKIRKMNGECSLLENFLDCLL